MYDIIIIGSGAAGLSAALYGKRAGFDVLVLEKNGMSGGQILNTDAVDNYLGMPGIGGFELAMKFREHAEAAGAVFQNAQVTGITDAGEYKRVTLTGGGAEAYEARSVVIATGASHALLHVPGEEKLTGHGVSYCATCDGAFFKNKTAAVVGGGDVAVGDAVFLARLCKKVYLIHRRNSLRAVKSLQDALFQRPNVEIIWNSVVEEICGKEQTEALMVRHVKENTKQKIAADGVFIAVGLHPNSELFQNVTTCDESGYIVAGEDCVTKTPGIFAAGDVRSKQQRQIITAVADGANAVMSIEKYFNSVNHFS